MYLFVIQKGDKILQRTVDTNYETHVPNSYVCHASAHCILLFFVLNSNLHFDSRYSHDVAGLDESDL